MIARHEGAIVLVSGAIPGETVEAEVEKVQRGTGWAKSTTIVEPSPDRVPGVADPACGGLAFAHVAYPRQLALKSAIIDDALRRIGRTTLDAPVDVVASPPSGYRMRARLHVRDGKAGFFREGTHALCDAAATAQLRDDSVEVASKIAARLHALGRPAVGEIELSENIDATARACHLELLPDADPSRLASIAPLDGLTGLSCAAPHQSRTMDLWGDPRVSDTIDVPAGATRVGATLGRHARSFFQGNRFLLAPLVAHVLGELGGGPVVDLFAGVGLFSVTAAAAGWGRVVAVESDRHAAADLRLNAAPFGDAVTVRAEPVEAFLRRAGRAGDAKVIVDPPRTGLSREALAGAIALGAARLVYVSCDVATLARDVKVLGEAGYRITSVRAFDLFPNTAHVETVMAFAR